MIRILVSMLTLAALALACGGDDDDTSGNGDSNRVEATANGVSATLTIPDAALPEDAGQIRVRAADLEDFQARLEGATAIASFAFEPDGLTFERPAMLTLRVPLDLIEGVAFLIEEDADGATIADELELLIDEEADEVVIELPVEHFSSKTLVTSGYIHTDLQPSSLDAVVGQPFSLTATIERQDITVGLNSRGGTTRWVLSTVPFQLRGRFHAQRPVSPTALTDKPPSTSVQDRFTVVAEFTCEEPSIASSQVDYIGSLRFQIRFEDPDQTGQAPRRTGLTRDFAFVSCTAPPQPTPTTSTDPGDGALLDLIDQYFGQDLLDRFTADALVLEIGGLHYPLFQFRDVAPDACGERHWHGDEVWPIPVTEDTVPITDPSPFECGFGKVSEVPEKTIVVTRDDLEAFFRAVGFLR